MIDYFIASETLLNLIPCFSVHNFQANLSDHCKISLILQTHICTNDFQEQLTPLSQKIVWNEDSPLLFQQALNSKESQDKLRVFRNTVYKDNDSQDAAIDFSNIIKKNAASASLKQANFKICQKKNTKMERNSKNLKWYDISLRKARSSLLNKGSLKKQKKKKKNIVMIHILDLHFTKR